MRSCAEVLRLLAERPIFDAEGKDMTAFLVFSLRGVYETIESSAGIWDEKNYWKKAEALRDRWRWAHLSADELEQLIIGNAWHEMPHFMVGLVQHFASVRITKLTRDSDWWVGAHRALVRKSAPA